MDFNKLKKQDFVITSILITLVIVGSFMIYSSTFNTSQSDLLLKQLLLVLGGLSMYFVLITLDIGWFKVMSIQLIMYFAIIGTLVYVNFFGSTIAGTNRWIDFGFFAFQPSEYAKIVIILLMAFLFGTDFLSEKPTIKEIKSLEIKRGLGGWIKVVIEKLKSNRDLKLSIISGIFVLPILLLTFIQPALGNTIIIFTAWILTLVSCLSNPSLVVKNSLMILVMLLIAVNFISFDVELLSFSFNFQNVNYVYIGLLTVALLVLYFVTKLKIWQAFLNLLFVIVIISGALFGWSLMGDYQKARIQNFVAGPEVDPLGSGYQVIQSKIAIGSGQLLGRGYLQGTQSSLHILTQAETDFAFAALSEQFGFVGSIMILGIYLILLLRILKVAKETPSKFGKIICFGVANLLLIHIFINVGMNLGKLPVTGIPLPLISYGGSSVLMTLILLGLVQAVYASRKPVDMADSLMLTSLDTGKYQEKFPEDI